MRLPVFATSEPVSESLEYCLSLVCPEALHDSTSHPPLLPAPLRPAHGKGGHQKMCLQVLVGITTKLASFVAKTFFYITFTPVSDPGRQKPVNPRP